MRKFIAAFLLLMSGCSSENVFDSKESVLLSTMARSHAAHMSMQNEVSHDGFKASATAGFARGMRNVQEIVAEATSWDDAMEQWKESPEHWSVASRKHRWYGKSEIGGYYCIITGD